MSKQILKHIKKPADLKKLTLNQLDSLCEEIREFLIKSVQDTGGHLASNLGAVELTVALNRIFSDTQDRIIYDVGHQCYTQKLLTDRKEGFAQLRQLGGVTGFPCPQESEHDAFITGHGNTSISAAVGMATAKKLRGEKGTVIAIIGDGSFGGGMVYEGMNNIDNLDNLIVILNDNEMSISRNVGGLSRYLTKLRVSDSYTDAKQGTFRKLHSVPLMGDAAIKTIRNVKTTVRRIVYQDTVFEMFGFQYFGIVDGHDLALLCDLLRNVKKMDRPVFLHIKTQKGKGHAQAESNPKAFHSVSPGQGKSGAGMDFSAVFGNALCKAAEQDEDIVAITAAMRDGTGLTGFSKQFKHRFFDVGMAEQHAVTFAAGLSKQGIKPVVAIYSTFLQRGYDQLLNDAQLNECDILLAVDRCGLVPADGETHQGIYDVSYLCDIKDVTIVNPCNFAELEYWLPRLISQKGIKAIRYARGGECETLAALGCTGKHYDRFGEGAKTAVITYGVLAQEALRARELDEHDSFDVFKLTQIYPIPDGLAGELVGYERVLFLHDDISGRLQYILLKLLFEGGFKGEFIDMGLDSAPKQAATVAQLRDIHSLNAEAILQRLNGGAKHET